MDGLILNGWITELGIGISASADALEYDYNLRNVRGNQTCIFAALLLASRFFAAT